MNKPLLAVVFAAAVAMSLRGDDLQAEAGRALDTIVSARPITLTVKRSGRAETVSGSGAASGGGVRFESRTVDIGADKFVQTSLGRPEWQPADFVFSIAPRGGYSFAVDLFPHATSVSGISMAFPTITTTAGAAATKTYRPGPPTFGTVTFTIARADDKAAHDWVKLAANGQTPYKDIAISIRSTAGEIRRIALRRALPLSWSVADSAIETIEVKPQTIDISGTALAPLCRWAAAMIAASDWTASVGYAGGARSLQFNGSFLTGYALGRLERDELRETWSLQPNDVGGLL